MEVLHCVHPYTVHLKQKILLSCACRVCVIRLIKFNDTINLELKYIFTCTISMWFRCLKIIFKLFFSYNKMGKGRQLTHTNLLLENHCTGDTPAYQIKVENILYLTGCCQLTMTNKHEGSVSLVLLFCEIYLFKEKPGKTISEYSHSMQVL